MYSSRFIGWSIQKRNPKSVTRTSKVHCFLNDGFSLCGHVQADINDLVPYTAVRIRICKYCWKTLDKYYDVELIPTHAERI